MCNNAKFLNWAFKHKPLHELTCSFFWVYLAAVLRFLPGFMPLPGARMGCERKHGAVIKPLPQQEVSHREEALIYALIMFSSSPSQTDLKWREYFVRCSRLNKNLSTNELPGKWALLQSCVELQQHTQMVSKCSFWRPEDGVWFLQNVLVLNGGNMLFGCSAIGFMLVVFAGVSSHTDWCRSERLVAREWT